MFPTFIAFLPQLASRSPGADRLRSGPCAEAAGTSPPDPRSLDLNRDGSLSPQEIQAAPASLRALDRDGDGQISLDELSPARTDASLSPDRIVAQLMHFDKSGNGVLLPICRGRLARQQTEVCETRS